MKLFDKAEHGVYNVGTGKATSFNTVAKLIGGKIVYAKNPHPYYPMLTKADMKKTLKVIGPYKFISIEEGIKKERECYSV